MPIYQKSTVAFENGKRLGSWHGPNDLEVSWDHFASKNVGHLNSGEDSKILHQGLRDHTLLRSHGFFEDRSNSGCASGRSMVTSWHCRMPWTVSEAWVRLGCGMSQWMGRWDGVGVGERHGKVTRRAMTCPVRTKWNLLRRCWGVGFGFRKTREVYIDFPKCSEGNENLTIQLNGKTYIPRITLSNFFNPFISYLFVLRFSGRFCSAGFEVSRASRTGAGKARASLSIIEVGILSCCSRVFIEESAWIWKALAIIWIIWMTQNMIPHDLLN